MRLSGVLLSLLATACSEPCASGLVCAIAGNGELGFNGDGPALDVRLASPTAVLTDADGDVIVVDYSNMRLRRLRDGELVTIAGNGIHSSADDGADALTSPIENPIDAALGPDGLLYLLPQHESRVLRLSAAGTLEQVAGTGQLGDTGDGGPALAATLGYGGGLAFDALGRLYIADLTHARVRRIELDGTIHTVLGVGEPGQGPLGYGPDTALSAPERLVVHQDRLVVADTGNHRVLALDLDTLQVERIAGTGEPGYSGDGGPATSALLHSPVGLAAYGDSLWIADLRNNAVRRVDSNGAIETVAGDAPGDPRRRAAPLESPLLAPAGLHLDGDDLLIAERGGQRVLRWSDAR